MWTPEKIVDIFEKIKIVEDGVNSINPNHLIGYDLFNPYLRCQIKRFNTAAGKLGTELSEPTGKVFPTSNFSIRRDMKDGHREMSFTCWNDSTRQELTLRSYSIDKFVNYGHDGNALKMNMSVHYGNAEKSQRVEKLEIMRPQENRVEQMRYNFNEGAPEGFLNGRVKTFTDDRGSVSFVIYSESYIKGSRERVQLHEVIDNKKNVLKNGEFFKRYTMNDIIKMNYLLNSILLNGICREISYEEYKNKLSNEFSII